MVLFSFKAHKDKKKSVSSNHSAKNSNKELIKKRLIDARTRGGRDPSGAINSSRSKAWNNHMDD